MLWIMDIYNLFYKQKTTNSPNASQSLQNLIDFLIFDREWLRSTNLKFFYYGVWASESNSKTEQH